MPPEKNPRQFDPLVDELPSRYVVGVDLGTTNCAVSCVDTKNKSWRVSDFPVPQLVAPGEVEARETLPSFHYQPASGEMAASALKLPWSGDDPTYAVGILARESGAKTPGRLIASAKSWLCHTGVDRTAELLPWQGAADVKHLSPVEVTARYLRHIRDAWNAKHPKEPLPEQDIVLTLPASFDEVARELTVEAAAHAGLPRVVLIEEPQAAFYAWVHNHAADWQELIQPGQTILVCDIGGGTSDFTLIRARRSTSGEDKVQFHRVAVGEHLILGGDNLDLALARHAEQKLAGDGKLEPHQWELLVRICRRVKEELLSEGAPDRLTVNLPGAGSKLIGGGLQVEVTRDEVRQILLDGFLPGASLDDKPAKRQSGFQEFGLPFAADPAITRYLAAFLTVHRSIVADSADSAGGQQMDGHDPVRPDIVLLNGGFFASQVLRERWLEVLASWFSTSAEPWAPQVLDNDRLDLAVARGAAYYGMVRRGEGVRITANLARSYYIGVESDQPTAVCLVPGSTEPGQNIELDLEFQLTVSQPVEFPLYVSSVRLTDQPGTVLPYDPEQMTPLPPIRTVLRSRSRGSSASVAVKLHARLTEIGTIELWCTESATGRAWRLQFDVRAATQTDIEAHEAAGESEGILDEATWQQCQQQIAAVFDKDGTEKPESLVKQLARVLETDRSRWPMPLLRRIWEALLELEAGRRKGAKHEARWLNLVGYTLRPGYGLAMDDWRVAETWRYVQGKLVHNVPSCRNESLILWRRVAGGLSPGQQRAVADPLLVSVRALYRRFTKGQGAADVGFDPNQSHEVWRLLGSLELLDVPTKIELGDIAATLIPRRKLEAVRAALVWCLGRLGQRIPVYGPLNTIVPRDKAESWLNVVLENDTDDPADHLAVMQLARRTDDRYRDLSDATRREAIDWLTEREASSHLIELVQAVGQLDQQEQGRVFGESLPMGLRIQ